MLNKELSGRKKTGEPQRRFMNVVTENMQSVGVSEEDVRDRVRWSKMICCVVKV